MISVGRTGWKVVEMFDREKKRREEKGEIEEMGGKMAGSCRLIEEVTMLQLGKVPFPRHQF